MSQEKECKEFDEVNKPKHYNFGDIEVIDFIKQVTNTIKNPFVAYCIGNTIKYVSRAMVKGKPIQDLQKAQWHLNKAIETFGEEGDIYVDNRR